ncbi:MAG: transketolase [Kiritimatiellae bacterium]|nr:transketolase [Verrucomicrobiota bacterium]MBU4285695.1 transketolase [Verrucomicrobiota bacterium]MCG2660646.1 transketolase [Kiritimatiellia bacterium]
MRKVFNTELLSIARRDPRIFMILADIGYGEIEPFAQAFPDRYFNCGVAEQAMTGIACGVAMEGNIAITYSIANFPTLRCLEQIRNDVCYHNANVKIVIIGGGMAYGPLGISHHSTEDLAIMRALPNLVVLAPSDFAEARAATHAMIAHEGPVYYRCGYKQEPPIHSGPIDFKIGRAITVREGTDATVIYAGTIGSEALAAVEALARHGIHCRLLSMHTLKPIDRDAILKAAKETGGIVTIEEHNAAGGLGGAVAEVLMDAGGLNVRCRRLALPDVNVSLVGSQQWLREQYHLTARDVVTAVQELLPDERKDTERPI